MKALRVAVLVLICVACGPRQPRTRGELDAARMKLATSLRAEERAPELWQALERAREAAAAAGEDEEARADQNALARLWLEAAISECERADLSAQRLKLETEIDALYTATERDRQAEAELTARVAHEAAAAIARAEVTRSLELAASAPVPRPKLDPQTEISAARALLTRAQLVIASARALGADPSSLTEASAWSEKANAALPAQPAIALEAADRALSRALSALGPVRAAQPEASAADKRSLTDDLEVTGARLTRDDRGLLATLVEVFGPGEHLRPTAEHRLSRVCAVAQAHPHGAVRFTIAAANPKAANRKQGVLSAALERAGCSGERFGIDTRQTDDDAALELSWLAY